MADKQLLTRIVIRNDTSTNWDTSNPILLKGEIGIATDIKKLKIGDGSKTWSQLDYFGAYTSDLGALASKDTVAYADLTAELKTLIDGKINNDVVASTSTLGLVKSSTSKNKVSVDNTGIMEVNTIDSSKIDGSVAEADQLSTPRTISISGAGTGSASFDGSADANIALTLTDSGVTAGTYTKVTVDSKGLVTSATNITTADVGGAGDIITHNANEFATAAQGGKADTAVQSVTVGNTTKSGTAPSFEKSELKSELGFIEATDAVVFTQAIKSQATTTSSDSAVLTTKGYVDDQIAEKLAASDAMVYKGTLGTGGTVTTLPTTGVVNGDTYKVITSGTYASQSAFVGDLFIAVVSKSDSSISWTLIPSGDDGNVSTNATLTANQLIIGNGNKEVGVLAAGTSGQVLRISDGTPTWTDETIDTFTSTDNSITATATGTYGRSVDIEVNQVSTDKLIQGSNVLVLDGGSASSFAPANAGE